MNALGGRFFLTAHTYKKLYWVTEAGRENATKMNARYLLDSDWVSELMLL